MNLVRLDPLYELDQFFNRSLSSYMGRWPRVTTETDDDAQSVWTPMLDVSETESESCSR
jgi:hypothetical protein